VFEFFKSLRTSKLTRKQTLAVAIFAIVVLLMYGLGREYLKSQSERKVEPAASMKVPAAPNPNSVNVQGNSNTVINNSTITTK
jgi:hypothetical protein